MRAEVRQSILRQLEEELRFVDQASKAAHEAATSEESKPENEYDTRALEASYLAEAQAKRAAELQRMIAGLRSMPQTRKTSVIESGSVVELDSDGTSVFYVVLPFGAGLAATVNGKKVSVVTLESPLGQVLVGRKVGDVFEFRRSGAVKELEVRQVF